MKARKEPTDGQMMKRLSRRPESDRDPRYKNDGYWVLRKQGYSDSYARRAYRDQPPVVHERKIVADTGGCDPEDLLFAPGSILTEIEVAIRPLLTEEVIRALEPREVEYTVWDREVRRFGVRLRPSGHKTYVVNYQIRFKTTLHKHTIGRVEDFSLEQARSIARSIRRDAREGIDPEKRIRERA